MRSLVLAWELLPAVSFPCFLSCFATRTVGEAFLFPLQIWKAVWGHCGLEHCQWSLFCSYHVHNEKQFIKPLCWPGNQETSFRKGERRWGFSFLCVFFAKVNQLSFETPEQVLMGFLQRHPSSSLCFERVFKMLSHWVTTLLPGLLAIVDFSFSCF